MGAWGFVSLAYGIVWGSILVYVVLLKRRYGDAAEELDALKSTEATSRDTEK